MNKLKFLIYGIILFALLFIVAENFNYNFKFNEPKSIHLYLNITIKGKTYFDKTYDTHPVPLGLYIIGSFILGCFVFYIKSLIIRFQTGRKVKYLNARMKVQLDELSSLRKEVEFLHRNKPRTIHVPSAENAEEDKTPVVNKTAEQS